MIVSAIIVNTTMANEIGIVANAYRENTQMFHTISSTAAATSSPMRVAGVRLTPPFWRTSLNRCTDPASLTRLPEYLQLWAGTAPCHERCNDAHEDQGSDAGEDVGSRGGVAVVCARRW